MTVVALITPHVAAHAQDTIVVTTDWGSIQSFSSAWREDAMAVHHSAAFMNSQVRVWVPGGHFITEDQCTVVNDGYATDPTDPGRKLHHALLIAAFLHGKFVRLVLQGCSYDKPRIIAVEVKD